MTTDLWIKIGLAVLCGSVIGVERQIRGKPSGIRTSNLVCLGTVIFIYLGQTLYAGVGDPGRTLGQVVTGAGALGAAGIIANINNNSVSGLTSASVIWILAAIGCAIGLEHYQLGCIITLLTCVILFCAAKLENLLKNWIKE